MYNTKNGEFFVRTPYERDRARIIHSNSFRSLQHKTQLFNIEDSDKTHTRLTHTLEVSQISNGLLRVIKAKYDPLNHSYCDLRTNLIGQEHQEDISQELKVLVQKYLAPDALMESICLTHDIGHSPYGHSGESELCRLMYYSGGFEGNAQTFRLLTRLANYSKEYGLDLTRRTLLGVIKYPHVFFEFTPKYTPEELENVQNVEVIKGIYQADLEAFNWVLAPLSPEDRAEFTRVDPLKSKTLHKSFDCSIMELADDIAYSIHDLEDAVNIQAIVREDWEEFFALDKNQEVREIFAQLVELGCIESDYLDSLFSTDLVVRRKIYSTFVDILISNVLVRKKEVFSEPLLDLEAYLSTKAKKLCNFFKTLEYEIAIMSQSIRGANNRGSNMIAKCFVNIKKTPSLLGRKNYLIYQNIQDQVAKDRFICDFLATMTNFELDEFYRKFI
ncbi:anti-phage deoxyguanosine triphosphatase [Psittacicella gerlachiana]|uniref:anti-phage deoxyguanosine triphosphatase n=1 Tax=Psittacicella gerlachiana TaxID=2028574 RepID=UPI001CA60853|nr:anti-phage deoxyguanosine triphosphatase [Psittacicella gerlachiana]